MPAFDSERSGAREMPGRLVRPDTAACAEPFMHGCMLAVDGGEHARAPPSDSAGVLAGAAHSVWGWRGWVPAVE